MNAMNRKIELLAPGGDIDSIKAAILAGADAVYCGLNRFNARNRATNLTFEALNGILHLAHKHGCQVFLTLNILLVESEIPALVGLLNKLIHTSIDGIIVQDLGVLYLVSTYFKGLKIHGSTQLNTHNEGQIKFLAKLSAKRVNLSRELSIDEIKALTRAGHENDILIEIFVHGSYCISFSGICYMSSVLGGKSGNRGMCSQPCRNRYLTTPEGKNYPLNLKDNSAYFDLEKLAGAGVDALKIEGRIKKFDYVFTVVNSWKKQLRRFDAQDRLGSDRSDLYKVFNRDFSNAYLKADISKHMFIDHPRDNSIAHLSDIHTYSTHEKMEAGKTALYEEKQETALRVREKIDRLSIAKVPLTISISGEHGRPLTMSVETPDTSFVVLSDTPLVEKTGADRAGCLNHTFLLERLKALNDTQFYIAHLELERLPSNLFISFKSLTAIKKKILSLLTGSKEIMAPIAVPLLKTEKTIQSPPALCVLISSAKDVYLCQESGPDIFFQLPNCFENQGAGLVALFLNNKKLMPWFPAVLIGENYRAALEFLQQVNPKRIVTNNTGIAYEAYKRGIPWIAGPYLNLANSFGLLCLKERFACYGAFISNELNNYQIKTIVSPENFKRYYRIYHPILLMTSRQCLFHQVTGCEKNAIDGDCIQTCHKSSSITNLKNLPLFIEKTQGNYHCIYNHINFLNTDIVTDLPGFFTGFFIDLRQIKTQTRSGTDKPGIMALFERLLKGDPDSKKEITQMIHPSTNLQYQKGI